MGPKPEPVADHYGTVDHHRAECKGCDLVRTEGPSYGEFKQLERDMETTLDTVARATTTESSPCTRVGEKAMSRDSMVSYSVCCTDGGEPWKDRERLIDLYERQGYTFREIGDLLGCSESTVNRWMKRHKRDSIIDGIDVEIPDDRPYTDPDLMERLYTDEKLSTEDMSVVLGCSSATVNKWLKKHGTQLRERSESVSLAKGGRKPLNFYTTKHQGYELVKTADTEVVLIHRLLAVAEYGFDAVAGLSVHHENGVPWDNRPQNLELLSRSDHRRKHGGGFTWLDHLRALEMYDECRSSYKVAEVIGCSPRTVRDWIHEIDPDMIDPPGAKA